MKWLVDLTLLTAHIEIKGISGTWYCMKMKRQKPGINIDAVT